MSESYKRYIEQSDFTLRFPDDSSPEDVYSHEYLLKHMGVPPIEVTTRKPYLNLGCGNIPLPRARPAHHALVDEVIYAYPEWTNIDRNAAPGVNMVADIFEYPWKLPDNGFDGALLAHIVEHIPHEIKLLHARTVSNEQDNSEAVWINKQRLRLSKLQNGWFAFWSELYRVLTPGAIAHVVSPYGMTMGGITDPTHTRYITEGTFTHSMAPDPGAPFNYETGCHFELVANPVMTLHEDYAHLSDKPEQLQFALKHHWNVAVDIAAQMRCVKDG